MKTVFIAGTAGSGKSLLASRLLGHYSGRGAHAAALNLDPGAGALPYECDADVRDVVDMRSVMERHGLGPNGALVAASDMAAARAGELLEAAGRGGPDYLIADTPGQVELFAYRHSGPFLARTLAGDGGACLFLFDGALVSSASNFVAVSLLAESVRIRMGLPMLCVLTKTDIAGGAAAMRWAGDPAALRSAVAAEAGGEAHALAAAALEGLGGGAGEGLVPVSGATGEGMAGLGAAVDMLLDMGEEERP